MCRWLHGGVPSADSGDSWNGSFWPPSLRFSWPAQLAAVSFNKRHMVKQARDFINSLQISTNYSTNYSFNSSLPLSLQLILVDSEPRVWHLLAAAGKTSPPVDAPPADEAAPADRPRLPSVGFGLFSGQATGELLQGAAQRHDGIHDGSSADVEVKSLVPHNEPEMIVIGKHSRRPLQLTQSWFPHLKTDSETDSSSTQSQCTCAPHDPSLAVLLRV